MRGAAGITGALFALLMFCALPARAADVKAQTPDTYLFDPLHTEVHFSVDHLGFSNPMGRFDTVHGGFTFDAKHPEKSTVDVTIDTKGVDMGASDTWNTALKSESFFNVKKFPTMTFKSTKIRKTGAKTGTVTGDLTLLGVTKPVTLKVTYNRSGTHPYNRNFIAGFSATAKLKRSDFGMTYGIPGVGDVVTIMIQVEGIRQDFTTLPR